MKIKLLILSLLISFFAFGQVPDTETFDLDTVVSVVNPTTPDLIDAFADTLPNYMNRTYYADYYAEYGNKLNLLMFRDYGPKGGGGIDTCFAYGLLYNWYATQGTGTGSITSSDDYRVGTKADYETLMKYYDSDGTHLSNTAANELKEEGTVHWITGNTGTNESKFNAVGTGIRGETGTFSNYKGISYFWNSDEAYSQGVVSQLVYNIDYFLTSVGTGIWTTDKRQGRIIRLIKTSTTLSHGQTSTYTGNDGQIYPTICIGTQEWLAVNLIETKLRSGDDITWYGADPVNYFTNAEWAALTTAGMCAYDNDVTNVSCDFVFPTP